MLFLSRNMKIEIKRFRNNQPALKIFLTPFVDHQQFSLFLISDLRS